VLEPAILNAVKNGHCFCDRAVLCNLNIKVNESNEQRAVSCGLQLDCWHGRRRGAVSGVWWQGTTALAELMEPAFL
jgi:hypothetical protein